MDTYDALLQIGNGLLLGGLVLCAGQRHPGGFLRLFSLLSWLEAALFLILALKQEEWWGMLLGASTALKGALLPYLLRRFLRGDESFSQGPRLAPSAGALLATVLLAVCLIGGRTLTTENHLIGGDTMGAALGIILVGLLSLGARPGAVSQIVSVALLEGGVFFTAASISPKVPLGAALFDILLLALLLGILVLRRDKEREAAAAEPHPAVEE
jgi:hydrogenase-4 membrane subunit HyfE